MKKVLVCFVAMFVLCLWAGCNSSAPGDSAAAGESFVDDQFVSDEFVDVELADEKAESSQPVRMDGHDFPPVGIPPGGDPRLETSDPTWQFPFLPDTPENRIMQSTRCLNEAWRICEMYTNWQGPVDCDIFWYNNCWKWYLALF